MVIIDTKYNISKDAAERITKACNLIASGMVDNLPLGRTEIDGSDIYVNVSEYETHKSDGYLWEVHRKYADIHYVIKGTEQIAYAPVDDMKITQEYSDEAEAALGYADGVKTELSNGRYVILLPDMAHCPGIFVDSSVKVKKAIIKVKL